MVLKALGNAIFNNGIDDSDDDFDLDRTASLGGNIFSSLLNLLMF